MMITCRHVFDHASNYLEGPVSLRERILLVTHLIICKHCRRYIRQLKLAAGIAARIPAEEAPTDLEINALTQLLLQSPPDSSAP